MSRAFCIPWLLCLAAGTASGQPAAGRSKAGPARNPALFGDSSSSHVHGEVADAFTGDSQRGAYYGEMYTFKEDGKFRHLVVGSGQVMSGRATEDGEYTAGGNVLTLRFKNESWRPDPSHAGQRAAYKDKPTSEVKKLTFSLRDAETLVLRESPTASETVLYKQRKK